MTTTPRPDEPRKPVDLDDETIDLAFARWADALAETDPTYARQCHADEVLIANREVVAAAEAEHQRLLDEVDPEARKARQADEREAKAAEARADRDAENAARANAVAPSFDTHNPEDHLDAVDMAGDHMMARYLEGPCEQHGREGGVMIALSGRNFIFSDPKAMLTFADWLVDRADRMLTLDTPPEPEQDEEA